jgi:hypothetical protein
VADPEAAATVEVREFRGHDQLYRVRIGDKTLMVISSNTGILREGERVRLEITDTVVPLPV